MLPLKSQSPFKTPTNTHSPAFPLPSQASLRGTISQKKEIAVLSSARILVPSSNPCSAGQVICSPQHHQLCRLCDLQLLTQNHMAHLHGLPARVLLPMVSHCLPIGCLPVSPHPFKLLRESSAWLLHHVFLLPKLCGQGTPLLCSQTHVVPRQLGCHAWV